MQKEEHKKKNDSSLYLLDDVNSKPFDFTFDTHYNSHIVSCHSTIVGLWSPILRICTNDERFKAQKSAMIVNLNNLGVSHEAFSKFIRSLYYLPDVDPTVREEYDEQQVIDILNLSMIYRVDRLASYCFRFIGNIRVECMRCNDIALLFDAFCIIVSVEDLDEMSRCQRGQIMTFMCRFWVEIMSQLHSQRDMDVVMSVPSSHSSKKRKNEQDEENFTIPSFYLKGLEKRDQIEEKSSKRPCQRKLIFGSEHVEKIPVKRIDITMYDCDYLLQVAERLSLKSLQWIIHLRLNGEPHFSMKHIDGKNSFILMLLFLLLKREANDATELRRRHGILFNYEIGETTRNIIDSLDNLSFKLSNKDEISFVIDEMEDIRVRCPGYYAANREYLDRIGSIKWSI